MTPERWSSVKTHFDAAVSLSPQEREKYWRHVAVDLQTRRDTETLLSAHDASGSAPVASLPPVSRDAGSEVPSTGSLHPAEDGRRHLACGDMVAGRFRIVRYIASGGMGDVHEAVDEELRAVVALKAIRDSRADDHQSIERLRREVNLARQITHPNVCRLHDLIHETTPEGRDRYFLSMEFVAGETLADRMRRDGALTAEAALDVARQAAAALDAAHAVGVVHRDFKPGNVILSEKAGGSRIVVTDFGLARSVDRDGMDDGSLTGDLQILGTAAYMSPEQLVGDTATPSSDIYSFGLVLAEMLTGSLPFEGTDSVSTALRRLVDSPTPPSRVVKGLDSRWDEVVLSCLERDPSLRPKGAGAAIARLTLRPPLLRRRGTLVAALSLGGLTFFGAVWMLPREHEAPAHRALGAQPALTRRTVAVLPLRCVTNSAEDTWLATSVTELLSAELEASDDLRVVSVDRSHEAAQELGLLGAARSTPRELMRAAERLDSDCIIAGSLLVAGAPGARRVRVELESLEVAAAAPVARLQVTMPEAALFELASQLGAEVRGTLGASSPRAAEEAAFSASRPSTTAAARFHAEGLQHQRAHRLREARESFEAAVRDDPTFAMAHSDLSGVLLQLGYDEAARREARRAVDLSLAMPERERLAISAQYHTAAGAPREAVSAWSRLVARYPDDPEARLLLAHAQKDATDVTAARATIESLRADFPDLTRDGRIDLIESITAAIVPDLVLQEAAAERAAAKAAARGERHLRAEALFWLGNARFRMGQKSAAGASFDEAKDLFGLAGDRVRMADALRWWGHSVPGAQGRLAESRAAQEQGLALYREAGSRRREGLALGAIGNLDLLMGRLEEAKARYTEAQGIFRETGAAGSAAWLVPSLAGISLLQGDLDSSQRLYETALDLLRDMDATLGVAACLGGLGRVQLERDRLDEAARLFAEATTMHASVDEAGDYGPEIAFLGADLALERGQGDEALALLHDVARRAGSLGNPGGAQEAELEIARALISLGRPDEARAAVARATAAAEPSEALIPRLRLRQLAVLLAGPSASPQELQDLENATSLASEHGLMAVWFELRLAAADAHAAQQRLADAEAALRDVVTRAEALGFARLARRAREKLERVVP